MFLIIKFHFWIFEKTSKFWAASYKIKSNLLLVRITVCIESFLPIGWRTWFGLRNVGILYSQATIQRPIVDFTAFLETGLTEKIAVCDYTTHDPNR